MFGFQGGEAADIVARKRGYMDTAQRKWPFLTIFDCSTIKCEEQLWLMVTERSGVSEDQAKRDVTAWRQDKQF
jgi:hypothetical protein